MGNNGGDGQVMARHLAGHNANVIVVFLELLTKLKLKKANGIGHYLKKCLLLN